MHLLSFPWPPFFSWPSGWPHCSPPRCPPPWSWGPVSFFLSPALRTRVSLSLFLLPLSRSCLTDVRLSRSVRDNTLINSDLPRERLRRIRSCWFAAVALAAYTPFLSSGLWARGATLPLSPSLPPSLPFLSFHTLPPTAPDEYRQGFNKLICKFYIYMAMNKLPAFRRRWLNLLLWKNCSKRLMRYLL